MTAGNSSQTSDGAAAVIVTSAERARERGLTPLGRFVAFATAGVEPERFGIGPVPAIRKALKLAGLTLDQIDLIELNEAFAAQVLACLKELPIDPGSAERERRRDRARPSARLHRREADDDAAVRDEAAKRPLRPGDDVRWRRDGRCRYLREDADSCRQPTDDRRSCAAASGCSSRSAPTRVFTPERLTDEHRLIAQTAAGVRRQRGAADARSARAEGLGAGARAACGAAATSGCSASTSPRRTAASASTRSPR